MNRVPELRIELDSLRKEARENLCIIISSLFTGVITGAFAGTTGNEFCIAGATVSLATLIGSMRSMTTNIRRQNAIEQLIEQIQEQAGMNIDEFMQRNPLAQVEIQRGNNIVVSSPDGSLFIGSPESPAGAGREERVVAQAEEMKAENPMRQRPRVTMRDIIPTLPINLPPRGLTYPTTGIQINPRYLAEALRQSNQ